MSKCLKIFLKNIPRDLPESCLDSDGCVQLELSPLLDYTRNKASSRLNQLGNFVNDSVLELVLADTPNNRAVLKKYGNWGSLPLVSSETIPIVAKECFRVLPQDGLCITGYSSVGWTAEIVYTEDTWETLLDECILCELLGEETFLVTLANLQNNWENHNSYQEGNPCYYFPLFHKGNWANPVDYINNTPITKSPVSYADFEPWFHIYGILKKAFKKIGYAFCSPFLESPLGRKLGMYINRDLCKPLESDKQTFFATNTQDYYRPAFWNETTGGGVVTGDFAEPPYNQAFANEMLFPNEDSPGYDPFDLNYTGPFAPLIDDPSSPTLQNYATGITGDCDFRWCVRIENTSEETQRLEINFRISDPAETTLGNFVANEPITNVVLQPGEEVTYYGTSAVYSLLPSYLTYLQIDTPDCFSVSQEEGPCITIKKGGWFTNAPEDVIMAENNTVNIGKFIDCEYSAYDVFKAIYEAIGGKVVVNRLTRKITLFTENPAVIWDGTKLEGFHDISKAVKPDNTIVCDSVAVTIKNNEAARYLCYGWCDSQDAYIEKLGFDTDNPIYAKEIDLGRSFNGEDPEQIKNSFFESSLSIRADGITPEVQITLEKRGPRILALWDNSDNKKSCKIKPRIAIFEGLIFQTYDSLNPVAWNFEGQTMQALPFAYFDPQDIEILNQGVPSPTLNYDSDNGRDWFDVFFKISQLEKALGFPFSAEALIDNCQFKEIDFREIWHITDNCQTWVGKLQQIDDKKPCTQAASKLIFTAALTDVSIVEDCSAPETEDKQVCDYRAFGYEGEVFTDIIALVNGVPTPMLLQGPSYLPGQIQPIQDDINAYMVAQDLPSSVVVSWDGDEPTFANSCLPLYAVFSVNGNELLTEFNCRLADDPEPCDCFNSVVNGNILNEDCIQGLLSIEIDGTVIDLPQASGSPLTTVCDQAGTQAALDDVEVNGGSIVFTALGNSFFELTLLNSCSVIGEVVVWNEGTNIPLTATVEPCDP